MHVPSHAILGIWNQFGALWYNEGKNQNYPESKKMCAIEWVQQHTSLVKYIVKNVQTRWYPIHSLTGFFFFFFSLPLYCFVPIHQNIWILILNEKTHITKHFEEAELLSPFLTFCFFFLFRLSFNKRKSAARACAADTLIQ